MAAVDSENELPFARDHPHQPLAVGGKRNWKRRPDTSGLRQDADEPDNIRRPWLVPKWIFRFQPHNVAAFAQHNFGIERQFAKQCGTELCSGSGFADNESSRCAHVYDIKAAQFVGENAWAKRSVSAHIDASEKDNESHAQHYEEKDREEKAEVR